MTRAFESFGTVTNSFNAALAAGASRTFTEAAIAWHLRVLVSSGMNVS